MKSDLEQVASNSTQINDDDRNQLLGLPKDFEGLFYGAIVEWDT